MLTSTTDAGRARSAVPARRGADGGAYARCVPDISALAVVLVAVAVAPLVTHVLGRAVPVPLPVVEILLGMLLGPALLGWVEPGGLHATLGRMGIAVLVYLAGYELDYRSMTGRLLARASYGWVLTLVVCVGLGIGVAFGANAMGVAVRADSTVSLVTSGLLIGIALTSTALGSSLPAMRDSGTIDTAFGKAVLTSGAIGQFAPLIALSILFDDRRPLWQSAVSFLVFAALVVAGILLSRRGLPRWAQEVASSTLHTSGHFSVRLAVASVFALAAVALDAFGMDMLIGAFAAGALMRQLLRNVDEPMKGITERKVQAVGFGFLIPVFFVSTGISFDLVGLAHEPLAIVLIPVFVVCLFVGRGLPGSLVLGIRGVSLRDRVAAALWTSVALAVVVFMVSIADDAGAITSVVGAAMIGAGMISVLVFPTLAIALRGRGARPTGPSAVEVAAAEAAAMLAREAAERDALRERTDPGTTPAGSGRDDLPGS